MHDARPRGIGVVEAVHAEPVPDRRQRGEHLAAVEAVVAAGQRLRLHRRGGQAQVVVGFAVAGREDPAVDDLAQDPVGGMVAARMQVGGRAAPVQVHVDGQRGGRREVGQPRLLAQHRGQVEPESAERLGHPELQVVGAPQVLEVLVEEAALAVVAGRARADAFENGFGEHGRLVVAAGTRGRVGGGKAHGDLLEDNGDGPKVPAGRKGRKEAIRLSISAGRVQLLPTR
ncbi:hypothetical protein [Variovorax sp. UC122_21]|uniref:hypothetical protein n=1 Tax=Variovorax sp. UC122_21 TaxID=3374554 RepID=UPI003757FF03